MSVSKLLARIVAPKIDDEECPNEAQHEEYLHDHTYGITSDPLTQFSVILSALIHDLGHPGVPNGQLTKEDPKLAALYQGKSVAEQNSVVLAWNALLLPDFDELRAAIFGSELELRRFRQLLVNSVIATDIFDKELGTLRRNRWNKAFDETQPDESQDSGAATNRKATIVIEHLIQASDVAHTMQHVSRSFGHFVMFTDAAVCQTLAYILFSRVSTSGKSMRNGTSVSSMRCLGPTVQADPTRIHPRVGIKASWGSLITTSFRSRTSSRNAVSLGYPATNTSTTPRKTVVSGKPKAKTLSTSSSKSLTKRPKERRRQDVLTPRLLENSTIVRQKRQQGLRASCIAVCVIHIFENACFFVMLITVSSRNHGGS